MLDRKIAPLRLDEFSARAVLAAVEREEARLEEVEAEARDRVDRLAWAMTRTARIRLHKVRIKLVTACDRLEPLPPEDCERFARELQALAKRLPRSEANGKLLDAQKAAEVARKRAGAGARRGAR